MPGDPLKPASPKRPARLVRKVQRRAPAPPAVPEQPLPGFGLPAGGLVNAWLEMLAASVADGGILAFEVDCSIIAGTLNAVARVVDTHNIAGDPVGSIVDELARRREPMSLAVLLAFARLTDGDLGNQAGGAAKALIARGAVAPPAWFDELEQPCTVEECAELRVVDSPDSMLLFTVSRAGTRHALGVCVDGEECDAADVILLFDPSEDLDAGLAAFARDLYKPGTRTAFTALNPKEARWRLETALARRDDHDAAASPEELLLDFAEEPDGKQSTDSPPYLAMLPLLTSRLDALPPHGRKLPPHPEPRESTLDQVLAKLLGGEIPPGAFPTDGEEDFFYGFGRRRNKPVSSMPKKRRQKDGPAPVYRLRIDVKGAKPPIWRRLEVAGDLTLAAVHGLIQDAFDWDDYHLHTFETEYGRYGTGESDRDTTAVTLEQLLRTAGDKLEYTYDFGDDWVHVIKLEKILDPNPGVPPRCTAGRRAAPPEDCGGIWSYEHDGPAGPDTFDIDALNRTLRANFDQA